MLAQLIKTSGEVLLVDVPAAAVAVDGADRQAWFEHVLNCEHPYSHEILWEDQLYMLVVDKNAQTSQSNRNEIGTRLWRKWLHYPEDESAHELAVHPRGLFGAGWDIFDGKVYGPMLIVALCPSRNGDGPALRLMSLAEALHP